MKARARKPKRGSAARVAANFALRAIGRNSAPQDAGRGRMCSARLRRCGVLRSMKYGGTVTGQRSLEETLREVLTVLRARAECQFQILLRAARERRPNQPPASPAADSPDILRSTLA